MGMQRQARIKMAPGSKSYGGDDRKEVQNEIARTREDHRRTRLTKVWNCAEPHCSVCAYNLCEGHI